MKAIKIIPLAVVLAFLLYGCGFFDDAKELAKKLEYYRNYSQQLEQQVANLKNVVSNLRAENNSLRNELQKYQDAHKRMMQ